ncbi:hypothetical protein N9295_00430 [bacterium]|nr:hypothetical protein [Candidatus Poseidoniales archaeon]MDB3879298.1 hypothetical protein [bacterium]MDC3316966.1 hypothetical protein [Candidatus Poseidoniaceae archaeon]MDA8716236.1 hypothetical protein [Candidatus Poseidoniales archaeon]MDA8718114.1 hypothetical protein [Candidatus Poseidoniales archaeon]|tara:strand:- start:2215 stop:2508 length:294 start_codon:yes stop_codon:yes gene_type:complete
MPEQVQNDVSDQEEIWLSIRSILSLLRVLILISTIVVSEFFEDHYILELTVAIWSLIIGIPLFFLISLVILWGNKTFIPVSAKEQIETVLRPILKRT